MRAKTKGLKEVTVQMVSGANIATLVMMLLVGYAGRLSPVAHPTLSTLTLGFPLFMLINVLFAVFWLVFKPRRVIIPVIGFIVSYVPVRAYMPLNVGGDAPEKSIKVLSYNVMAFHDDGSGDDELHPIIDYILNSNADIVCLQESNVGAGKRELYDSLLAKTYLYYDHTLGNAAYDELSVYSKYPVVSIRRVPIESEHNMVMAYDVVIDGDTVLVVNSHLETNGMSEHDKRMFREMVTGDVKRDSVREESGKIFAKLTRSNSIRGAQADVVADYIESSGREHVIVCGDFNSDPLSYAHNKIGENLTDCYIATANGVGWSYHRSLMYFRIDNIFCSKSFTPYACRVDSKIKASDHYPIYCWLKKNKAKTPIMG